MSKVDEEMDFIENELLPEMVQNRCFCAAGSREFVEFISAKTEPSNVEPHQLECSIYRVEVVVEFSGEAKTFNLLVKLLSDQEDMSNASYGGFLNEEMMWNKASLQYGRDNDFFPYYYVADMGRYGRPVIVVEDLEKSGFRRVTGNKVFSGEEAKALVEFVGRFHGKGLALKESKYEVFREFPAKFQETIFDSSAEPELREKFDRLTSEMRSLVGEKTAEQSDIFKEYFLNDSAFEKLKANALKMDEAKGSSSTICQGLLIRENVWFKKTDAGDTQIRIFDWQRVRYGSNSLDLATILAQCDKSDWEKLLRAYVDAVKKEHPRLTGEKLIEGITDPGLFYALLVSSLEKEQVLRLF